MKFIGGGGGDYVHIVKLWGGDYVHFAKFKGGWGIMIIYTKISRGDFIQGGGDIVHIPPFMLTLAKMQNDSTLT